MSLITIGKVEIERLKETKFDGSRAGKNFTVDRQIERSTKKNSSEGRRSASSSSSTSKRITRPSATAEPRFCRPAKAF